MLSSLEVRHTTTSQKVCKDNGNVIPSRDTDRLPLQSEDMKNTHLLFTKGRARLRLEVFKTAAGDGLDTTEPAQGITTLKFKACTGQPWPFAASPAPGRPAGSPGNVPTSGSQWAGWPWSS